MSSIYDEYEGEIKQYILEGYNIKEISKKLNEEHGLYGCYNGIYDFCRRHGIVAKAERHCKNCQNCGTEIGTETPIIFQALGHKKVTLTDNCEKVIAKKTLFGWKVKTG